MNPPEHPKLPQTPLDAQSISYWTESLINLWSGFAILKYDSMQAEAVNAQQDPHEEYLPWFLALVTAPEALQST